MKKIFTLLIMVTVLATMGYSNRTKMRYIKYTVSTGDSLFAIAKNHNTTTSKIRITNGLTPDELIHVGQKLKIATGRYLSKNMSKKTRSKKLVKTHKNKLHSKNSVVEYTVQSGDTLYTIAHKHHTTSKEILEKNNLELSSIIKVNQVLKVPTNTYKSKEQNKKLTTKKKTKESSKKKEPKKVSKNDTKKIKNNPELKQSKINYAIEKGDTLYSIAKKHHTSTREILAANNMKRGTLIRVGQVLSVPTNTYFTDEDTIKEVLSKQIEAEKVAKGIHTIKAGDTLFSIALKNHVTLKELMKFNKLKANSVLKIGQELKVTKQASYLAKKSHKKTKKSKKKFVTKKYKIRRGDTLSKIAKKYKISVKKLRELNNLKKKYKLKVGVKLAVSKVEVKPKIKKHYKVKKGDTVWLIAKKNHMTVKKLRSLNKLTRKSKIRTGMILAIADTKKSRSKSRRLAKKSKSSRRTNALSVLNGKSRRRGGSNSKVIRTAKRYLGKRYVWGAVGPNKFDCSGFTQYVLRKSKGVRIPRVSRKQAYYGKYVSRSNLRPGDLIFFDTSHRRRGYVNHVGIYIGGNKFIHASSARHRVVITSLNRPFYKARFKWGRRVN